MEPTVSLLTVMFHFPSYCEDDTFSAMTHSVEEFLFCHLDVGQSVLSALSQGISQKKQLQRYLKVPPVLMYFYFCPKKLIFQKEADFPIVTEPETYATGAQWLAYSHKWCGEY